jgi:hypothetical protein
MMKCCRSKDIQNFNKTYSEKGCIKGSERKAYDSLMISGIFFLISGMNTRKTYDIKTMEVNM